MGLPRHIGSRDSGSGRGPFGEKAFRGALIGCVGLVVIGLPLVLLAGASLRAVGACFLTLGVLLATGGGGLLLERVLRREPPPPPDVTGGNGRGRHAHIVRLRRP